MGLLTKLRDFALKLNETEPTPLRANRNRIVPASFSVKGKNPETGRRKTVYVITEASASIEEVQRKSGLLPPYEIERISDVDPPSDAQIHYAEKLGFAFPVDATMSDATVFLTRCEEGRPLIQEPMPDNLARYLIEKGIAVPAYAGAEESTDLYLSHAGHQERASYFCMRVFCSLTGRRYCFIEDATSDERKLFADFAHSYGDDTEFRRSLSHYGSEDMPLGSFPTLKKLNAYDVAAAFLKERGIA